MIPDSAAPNVFHALFADEDLKLVRRLVHENGIDGARGWMTDKLGYKPSAVTAMIKKAMNKYPRIDCVA